MGMVQSEMTESDETTNKNYKQMRSSVRCSGEGYTAQVYMVNGETRAGEQRKTYQIENISKGGFRFHTPDVYELEDRVQVMLHFPDKHAQEVLGRICYSDELKGGELAYGFSIIKGFYSLPW